MQGRGKLLLAGVLTVLVPLSGCSTEQSMFDQKVIQVGTKNNQPGTSVQTLNHTWEGFDVQVANQATKALGSTTHFSDVSSDQRERVLQEHAADLVVATYSITQARTDLVDFAGPYAVTYQGFMIRAESTLNGLEDLRGKVVCSWGGTTSMDELNGQSKNLGLIPVEKADVEECRKELMENRVFAVSTDQLLLYGLAQVHPGVKVVPEVTIGSKNYYGVGIRKDRREDCGRIRDFLKHYVVSSDWVRDLQTAMPGIARPEDFRPDPMDIGRFSCVDKIK
ncbi:MULTISPECIES: transporter substrate-binding domain-containing protein [unclassified Kitasatospora]|uniref:transporter substrate-binding domain-containing protein n=1 Tax=unclassified Kitasatospora TaxID=2633591 RepID=UPI00070FE83E|nr:MULTISPECIES: transporter substrate-binding domain-containing protein [unclassified Kitasatospora]KQV24093.1 hypothetical protein ASC99_02545 [Kitasatospora sp. Root107]KRB67192.1 hypothetical protein ASE03_02195 [Kitasatospora sp. Root187]